jgi:hypothetical protein
VAVCWASLVGALVWGWLGPSVLLGLAFAFGVAGAVIYYALAREPRPASGELTRAAHLS